MTPSLERRARTALGIASSLRCASAGTSAVRNGFRNYYRRSESYVHARPLTGDGHGTRASVPRRCRRNRWTGQLFGPARMTSYGSPLVNARRDRSLPRSPRRPFGFRCVPTHGTRVFRSRYYVYYFDRYYDYTRVADIAPLIAVVREYEGSYNSKRPRRSDRRQSNNDESFVAFRFVSNAAPFPIVHSLRTRDRYRKNTDRRIGNPIAADAVDASPQIDPFHTIRPIRTYGRAYLKGPVSDSIRRRFSFCVRRGFLR